MHFILILGYLYFFMMLQSSTFSKQGNHGMSIVVFNHLAQHFDVGQPNTGPHCLEGHLAGC